MSIPTMAMTTVSAARLLNQTNNMIDDFLIRALLAGIGIVLVTGPVGCQIVWQRMAYFGDTVAHSALLGIAFALLLNVNMSLGAFLAAAVVAVALLVLGRQRGIPADALLGILAHGSLATGLVLVSLIDGARVDLVNVLFGDILAVSNADLVLIFSVAAIVLLALTLLWRPLLATTVSADIAAAEESSPGWIRFVFLLMVAAVVAIAVKIVGVLLLTAMLIIPASAARVWARSPEAMAVIAVLIGILAVCGGLALSLYLDTPSGASIVLAATVMFLLSQVVNTVRTSNANRSAANHG